MLNKRVIADRGPPYVKIFMFGFGIGNVGSFRVAMELFIVQLGRRRLKKHPLKLKMDQHTFASIPCAIQSLAKVSYPRSNEETLHPLALRTTSNLTHQHIARNPNSWITLVNQCQHYPTYRYERCHLTYAISEKRCDVL
jgi:hypothetical protein